MILPALRRGNAAAKLERANGEFAKCEASIVELRARLSALDPESDDYQSAAQTIGGQINVQEKALSILIIQVAGLEQKVAEEESREKERRRVAAVAQAQTLMALWPAALEKHVQSIRAVETSKAALVEVVKKISAGWPEEIDRPMAFFFDVDRVLRAELDDIVAIGREQMADLLALYQQREEAA